MANIFKYVPYSPTFWTPVQFRSTDSFQPLHSGLLLTADPHTSQLQSHFSFVTKQLLCQCSSSAPGFPLLRLAHIRWATVLPFSQHMENTVFFGFALKYREEKRDFYVSTEEELESWMQALERICVLQDIEEDFSIGELVGTGEFAAVHSGANLATGERVAIKRFDKLMLLSSEKRLFALVNEIKVLRELTHPRILALYRVYESLTHVMLVTEFIPGKDLFGHISFSGVFTPSEAHGFMQNLLEVLKYMDDHSVLHRDIKPEHLILTDPNDKTQFKLRSFDFATKYSGRELRDVCGSPGYMAPEILLRQPYGPTVDLYSAGIVFYIILSGYSPFYSTHRREIIKKNSKNEIFFVDIWAKSDPKSVKLIETMTNSVASLRTSPTDLLIALSGGMPRPRLPKLRASALLEKTPLVRKTWDSPQLFPSVSAALLPMAKGSKSVPKSQHHLKGPEPCSWADFR